MPIKEKSNAQVNKVTLFKHVVKKIENLERFYEAKVQAGGSKIIPKSLKVNFGSESVAFPSTCDKDGHVTGSPLFSDDKEDFGSRWVPPNSVNKEDDYNSSALKKGGHL